MRMNHCILAVLTAGLLLGVSSAQDSPSLGDVARKTRQQKEATPAKPDAKPKKVITNEEMPEHPELSPTEDAEKGGTKPSSEAPKQSADQWRSQILAQKNAVASLQSNIDNLNDSIQFAPGNCVAGCVEWNQEQQRKQQEVARMRKQLESQKKKLADMQDAARQQGYGSSVYNP